MLKKVCVCEKCVVDMAVMFEQFSVGCCCSYDSFVISNTADHCWLFAARVMITSM